jgi:hypothetical protein
LSPPQEWEAAQKIQWNKYRKSFIKSKVLNVISGTNMCTYKCSMQPNLL